MIKFFRKIRQRLVEQSKVRSYFVYAIGEIVLVVIGILIALQINNWNEDRNFRKQEVKYLKKLKSDITLEFDNNDSIINYRAATAKAAAHLLDFKKLETAEDVISLEITINKVFTRLTFIPTNNTYKELLNSGNLNFITNDSIKDFLMELDKMYTTIHNIEYHMYREYEEYLYNVMVLNVIAINLFDFKKTADKSVITLNEPNQIPFEIIIPQYNKLLQKKEFINGLRLSIMNNMSLTIFHENLTLQLKKLNDLINKELKK
ncbi:MAG: hypothetical protein GW772_05125 [Flavobacteriia bacterium]|nr:hypothetical protein [Flavobacteriia bacterium]NCT60396.1 hypothetical protein [Flavobacteriia bacterium]OIP45380.1 MAG: hypothetical protein AUK46_12175 [Flavobacteriaceae bacterium CG2_30_31_66]PIY13989.1 MAG: hypothetical protein COZ16_11845 [Flavobacteriaceae bacterium CG_4_10_14_3_um_filter_31_253]PIZ11031.1 MAG: hypothetical protein COY55_06525 [Flavobacteriaceae bacterium CG_4_10_14_0_8_um_filter_31_99]